MTNQTNQTRMLFDSCAYNSSLKQSTAPLSYYLDPIKYENCNKCRMELGIVGGTAVSQISGDLVDLESDLRGQNRPNTHCPAYKYMPPTDNWLQGREYIKPVDYTPIDLTLKHLPPCQMISYGSVPKPPTLQQYRCGI